MSDIIDINVAQTVEEVTINVTEEVIQVNINQVNGGGGIESVVAGTNISVDNTDADNPIVSATGLVPYNGATSDVNLGEFGMLTGNIEFDNTPTNIPTASGSVYWNDADGTLDLILKGGNVKLQVGQESVIRVVNKTATNIDLLEANYQAVRVTGAQGQRLKVDLAQATTDNLSAETIGLVTETINNNQEGFITTSGLVRNINTTGSLQGETWADGDIVYLSPTVAGRITKVKPVAPNHLVIIGYVISAHATQGSIFVKVDNGYELDELHNVKIDTPLNNQGLIYNSTLQVWENKKIDLQSVLTNGGTVIEGDNELYLNVIDGILDYSGNGATSGFQFNIGVDQDVYLDNVNIPSGKRAQYRIDTNGNLKLIQKSASDTFGTEITITEPTANRSITFKDESGTVALTSDIPSPITIDATPTDGSSNAVSSNGVFDALDTKVSKSDYTPAHSILVQQSGTGTPTALSVGNNTLVGRLSGGGSDINDLSVSDVRTLLSIDTDLALKQDKSTSETFVLSKANGTFGSHTGTTAETVLFSADISANEFTAGDFMRVMLDITKVGTAGTASVRVRAGTAGTTSDALIGTLFLLSGTLDAGWIRERFQFLSGNLLSGIQTSYTSAQTDIAINSAIKQSTSLTPSSAWKITVSVALANSADTVSCLGYRVSKIKSI
jgi:hypothetical protein